MIDGLWYRVHFDDGTERKLLYDERLNPGSYDWNHRSKITFCGDDARSRVEVKTSHIVWIQ